jgi:hypothetical protein
MRGKGFRQAPSAVSGEVPIPQRDEEPGYTCDLTGQAKSQG